jgi:hypothetical protein
VAEQEQFTLQDQHHIVPLILVWVVLVVVGVETLLIQDMQFMVFMAWQILVVELLVEHLSLQLEGQKVVPVLS